MIDLILSHCSISHKDSTAKKKAFGYECSLTVGERDGESVLVLLEPPWALVCSLLFNNKKTSR